MIDFGGRGVLVTGGARSLGLAVALATARHGASVVLSCAPDDKRADLAKHGVRVVFTDAATEQAVDRLFDTALEYMPSLSVVVVHVDGSNLATGKIADTRPDVWRRGLSEPLRASFLVCRRAVEEFLSTGKAGRVVLMFDGQDNPRTAASLALDQGLRSLVRSIAKEYGRGGITCNMVGVAADIGCRAPEQRLLSTKLSNAVNLVLGLASSEVSYVTGDVLVVG